MNFRLFLALSLLGSSLGEPRKANMVSQMVDSVLENLSNKNVTLGDVSLGKDVGRMFNLTAGVSGGLEKMVDGDASYGLKLETTIRGFFLSGLYELKEIDPLGMFVIFGKGGLLLEVGQIDLKMHLKARRNFETERFDVQLPIFSLSLQETKLKLDNLMEDPPLADFLCDLLSALIPDLVDLAQDVLKAALQPVIDFFLNEVITCIKNEALTGRLEECIRNITRVDSSREF